MARIVLWMLAEERDGVDLKIRSEFQDTGWILLLPEVLGYPFDGILRFLLTGKFPPQHQETITCTQFAGQ